MSYIIAKNKNHPFKVHYKDCKSIRQVIGDKPSNNQKYSDILENCEDVREWLKNNGNLNYVNCMKCNPSC